MYSKHILMAAAAVLTLVLLAVCPSDDGSDAGPSDDVGDLERFTVSFNEVPGITYTITEKGISRGEHTSYDIRMAKGIFYRMTSLNSFEFQNNTYVRVNVADGYILKDIPIYVEGSDRPVYCWPNTAYNHLIRGNTEFIPNNEAIVYDITYPIYAGQKPSLSELPSSYTVEDHIDIPRPELEGYVFEGWSPTPMSSTKMDYVIMRGTTGDITLYDHWRFVNTEVRLDMNGVTPAVPYNEKAYQNNNGIVDLPDVDPVADGYTFLGWYTEPVGGKKITDNMKIQGDVLYAHWDPIVYSINYFNMEGADNFSNPTQYTTDKSVSLSQPVKDGFRFAGWSFAGATVPVVQLTIPKGTIGDLDLTANWITTGYDVRLDLNGVSTDQPYPEYVTTDAYRQVDLPDNNPTAEGYIFIGWFTDPVAGDKVEDNGFTDADVLYAHWTTVEYRITYTDVRDADNSANPTSYTVEDEVLLKPLSYEGLTFRGWVGNGVETPTPNLAIQKGTTGDIEFRAVWDGAQNIIVYNGLGGADNSANPLTYNSGETVVLTDPTRDGYTFLGWTGTGVDEPTKDLVVEGAVGDLAFTAHWVVITYSITYIAVNDASNAENPATYTVEDSFMLADLSRNGYTFLGWTGNGTDAPTKDLWVLGGTTGDLSFTAHWEAIVYTVSYYGMKDADNLDNPDTYTIETTFTLKDPVREGYTFLGWIGKGMTEPTAQVHVDVGTTGDLKFAAFWSVDGYDIEYVGIEGAFNFNNPSGYAVSTGFELKDPVKKGYTFLGWTGNGITEPTKSVKVEPGTEGDLVFTAHWSVITYTITYIGVDGADNKGNPTSYTVEDSVSIKDPTKAEYRFTGWQVGDNGPTVMSFRINAGTVGDIKLTAHWTFMSSDVILDLNGKVADVPFNGQAYRGEDMAVDLPEHEPTSKGYTFAGWYTEPDGGKKVADGDVFTGDILYAHWDIVVYTLTYTGLEGATCPDNPASYTVEDRFTLDNPWKTGNLFLGWNDSRDGEVKTTVYVDKGTTGNLVFDARFKIIEFPIQYKGVLGASNDNPSHYNIYSEFDLNQPVREGYDFLGWGGSGLEDLAKQVHVDKGTTGKLVYTAYWKMTVYQISYDGVDGAVNDNPDSYGIRDLPLVINNPSRVGSEFVGWDTGNGVLPDITLPEGTTGDIKLTAVWKPSMHSVTVTADGGNLKLNGNDVGEQTVRQYGFGTEISCEGDTMRIGDDTFVASSDMHDVVTWSVQDNLSAVMHDMAVDAVFSDSHDMVKEIAIFSMPDKTDYLVGEDFDSTGMVLSVMYRSGNIQKVSSGYTVDPVRMSSVDIDSVTITYQGFETSCPVDVRDVFESISITTPPDRTVYRFGEAFDPTGMVVEGKFVSGETRKVTGYEWFPQVFDLAGKQKVEVTYNGQSAYQDVTVLPELEPDFTKGKVLIQADASGHISGEAFSSAVMAIAGEAASYGPSVDVFLDAHFRDDVVIPSGILYTAKGVGAELHVTLSNGTVTLDSEALYTDALSGSGLSVSMKASEWTEGPSSFTDGGKVLEVVFVTDDGTYTSGFDSPITVRVGYTDDEAENIRGYMLGSDGSIVSVGDLAYGEFRGNGHVFFKADQVSKFVLKQAGTEFSVNTETEGDGMLTVSPDRAEQYVRVTVTASAADGSTLESITVDGTAVDAVDGVYAFDMPASDVTVKAVFSGASEETGFPTTAVAAAVLLLVFVLAAVFLIRRRA